MTSDMVLEKMFPPAGESLGEAEMDYLGRLIAVAELGNKTPVLTCTRNLGRAQATRLSFPNGVHIVTVRNLWHQWMSYCNQHLMGNSYFLAQIDKILCVSSDPDPMLAHLRERFAPADDIHFGEPPTERLFYAFVGLHLYMYARAFQAADIVVDVNRLATELCYRKEKESKIYDLTGMSVDFSDVSCRVEYGPSPMCSLEELRANVEPLFLVASANAGVKADDKSARELRQIVNELYDEAAKFSFYTQSLRNEHMKMSQAFEQTSLELIATESRNDELGNQLQLNTDLLASQTVALETQAGTLGSHTAELSAHAGKLDSHTAELSAHAGTLDRYAGKLRTHAAKLAAEKIKNHELEIRLKRLERKLDKGPLHLRQLFRHPKAFAGDVFGLKVKPGKNRFSHLNEGFVDENKTAYLSLKWIIRQPTKAVELLIRQPRKAVRFILRHPSKFIFNKENANNSRGHPSVKRSVAKLSSGVATVSQPDNSDGKNAAVSPPPVNPEVVKIYNALKLEIQKLKTDENCS